MSIRGVSRGAFTIWHVLLLAQLRESPVRLSVTVLAIALGVALGAAVYLVNSAALNEFGLATKRLVGEADVIVRGPREGFSEQLFTRLARDAAVSEASPVLELDVALPGRRDTLKVLGVDPFRAAALQPALIGDIGGALFTLFQSDSIYLSSSAAQELKLRRGDELQVLVGSSPKALRVLGIQSTGPIESHRSALESGHRRRRFSPCSRPALAGRCPRHRPAGRARPRHHRDARIPGQSEYAGARRTLDGGVLGVFDAVTIGAAQTPLPRTAAGARRNAGSIAAGAHR